MNKKKLNSYIFMELRYRFEYDIIDTDMDTDKFLEFQHKFSIDEYDRPSPNTYCPVMDFSKIKEDEIDYIINETNEILINFIYPQLMYNKNKSDSEYIKSRIKTDEINYNIIFKVDIFFDILMDNLKRYNIFSKILKIIKDNCELKMYEYYINSINYYWKSRYDKTINMFWSYDEILSFLTDYFDLVNAKKIKKSELSIIIILRYFDENLSSHQIKNLFDILIANISKANQKDMISTLLSNKHILENIEILEYITNNFKDYKLGGNNDWCNMLEKKSFTYESLFYYIKHVPYHIENILTKSYSDKENLKKSILLMIKKIRIFQIILKIKLICILISKNNN